MYKILSICAILCNFNVPTNLFIKFILTSLKNFEEQTDLQVVLFWYVRSVHTKYQF